MDSTPYTWCICIVLLFIEINAVPLKKSSSGGENANQNNLSEYEKQLEDEDVRELKNLKSSVNKNGELMERVQQKIDSKQESESVQPKTQVLTEIEIAPKSNHKWSQDDVQIRDNFQKKMAPVKQKHWSADNAAANNLLDQFKMKTVVKYLPVEMADYIYQTGDERSVTMAIENYLRLGIMDRDEAIAYLQEIKSILNTIKENDLRDKKQEQQRRYMEMYENSRNNRVDMNQALSDLKDIQQLIQNKFLKRAYTLDNFENQNTRYRYNNKDEVEAPENYIDEGVQFRFSEKDYKNLAEKLQGFESLFSESSMEGVIYELAKVLFYQSFSMNGLEAQESLKQFTTFLETQVDEGHISPNIERKVLDILLAALTDTLNEHPEIMYGKSAMEQFPKQSPGTGPSVPSGFKIVEKKSGTGNKNRHDKMNLEVSGILDDDKH
ncbi:uncharacterized protein LOC135849167 isoform X2 [Planococcus citri]|uniref:uncharacterized protein LOC135849167 isoform X2 n=1 Tax=Planococcus citri TaxID=170843 RepID=UPI0031F81B84